MRYKDTLNRTLPPANIHFLAPVQKCYILVSLGNPLLLLGGELLLVLFTLVIRDGGILVLLVLGNEIVHVGLSLSELPVVSSVR